MKEEEEERKKKNKRKAELNNNKKKKDDSYWQKKNSKSNLKKKSKKTQHNPFSVLHKDHEEVGMEEKSRVFKDSSRCDHLPKGTLPRLPIT